jgi:hypothetical protein
MLPCFYALDVGLGLVTARDVDLDEIVVHDMVSIPSMSGWA